MLTPVNAFKQALNRGETQIGLWLALADAYAAELCAGSGFDWLLIDGEHAPNDLRTMLAALQAIAAYPVRPVVRIPHGDQHLIKQVLDIGATTLMVPMVESPEQASELVRAVRYPPLGVRGVGSAIARSSRWSRYANYLHEANAQISLIVQVETQAALVRVKDIAAVEGVDGVFIGPTDLSASAGFLGQADHPQVRAMIAVAFERIASAGKAPGILCSDPTLARYYISVGARFIAVGVDTTLLARASNALAASFKSPAVEGLIRQDATTDGAN
jgi:4-hydroxy-2-oxoheptanedioate aldolase